MEFSSAFCSLSKWPSCSLPVRATTTRNQNRESRLTSTEAGKAPDAAWTIAHSGKPGESARHRTRRRR